MGGVIDAPGYNSGATAREELKDIGETGLAVLDRASAVSDVTVSRKGANPSLGASSCPEALRCAALILQACGVPAVRTSAGRAEGRRDEKAGPVDLAK